jgi:hypothetical protein
MDALEAVRQAIYAADISGQFGDCSELATIAVNALRALPVEERMKAMGMRVSGWRVPDHGWFEYDDHPGSVGYCVEAPEGGIAVYVEADTAHPREHEA